MTGGRGPARRRVPAVAGVALAAAALGSPGVSRAGTSPWTAGGAIDVADRAALVIEGRPGGRAGLSLAVADWNDDGVDDLVVAEPWADVTVGLDHRPDAGRIGVFLGPWGERTPAEGPVVRSMEDADVLLRGPAGGRLGHALEVLRGWEGGDVIAAAVPGAFGTGPEVVDDAGIARSIHAGEVWLLHGGGVEAPPGPQVVDAADRRWHRGGCLWWGGWTWTPHDGGGQQTDAPNDVGHALGVIADRDGDGLAELAIGSATRVRMPPSRPVFHPGRVLVVPSSVLTAGVDGDVPAGWILDDGDADGGLPLAGHALSGGAGGPPPTALGVGSLARGEGAEVLPGAIYVVPGDPFGAPPDGLELLALDEAARIVEGAGQLDADYALGAALALDPGGDALAVAATGRMEIAALCPEESCAVTEVFPDGLAALGPGEVAVAGDLAPWTLVGAETPFDEWVAAASYELFDQGDVDNLLRQADAALLQLFFCLLLSGQQEEVIVACVDETLSAFRCAGPLTERYPRATHVPVWFDRGLAIGEPIHGESTGAVHVVAGDLDAGVPTAVRLDPLSPPDGWTTTRIDGDTERGWFGHSVLAPGDLDGDGLGDLVIGAPGDASQTAAAAKHPGRVHVLLSAPWSDADDDGHRAVDGDCDDADPQRHPGADEHCNGVDDDCDGAVDEDPSVDGPTWYLDADGDGFGGELAVSSCAAPPGHVATGDDCDDGDPGRHPGAAERADGLDDDCDGWIDEGFVGCAGCGWSDAGRPDPTAAARGGTALVLLSMLGLRRRRRPRGPPPVRGRPARRAAPTAGPSGVPGPPTRRSTPAAR